MKADKRNRVDRAHSPHTYTRHYDDLVTMLSHESLWYIGLTGVGLLLLIVSLSLFARPMSESEYLALYVGAIGFAVMFLYALLVVTLGISAAIDPLREVTVLAVWLMSAVPQPHAQEAKGLSYRDIEHLRRIAEIEQSSADWRGSFVSFVIIGTISVLIWILPTMWRVAIEEWQPAAGSTPVQVIPAEITSEWLFSFLLGAALVVLVIGLVWKLLNYFRVFLGGEAANRIILKACQEALAFLEKRDLREQACFSLREKRAMAAHFGCRLVPAHEASWGDKLWMRGAEPDGARWYLVPPVSDSPLLNLRLKARGARMWLRSKGFWKPDQ